MSRVVDLAGRRRPAPTDDHRHCPACGGVWWRLGARGAVVFEQETGRIVGYSAQDNTVACVDCGHEESVAR